MPPKIDLKPMVSGIGKSINLPNAPEVLIKSIARLSSIKLIVFIPLFIYVYSGSYKFYAAIYKIPLGRIFLVQVFTRLTLLTSSSGLKSKVISHELSG